LALAFSAGNNDIYIKNRKGLKINTDYNCTTAQEIPKRAGSVGWAATINLIILGAQKATTSHEFANIVMSAVVIVVPVTSNCVVQDSKLVGVTPGAETSLETQNPDVPAWFQERFFANPQGNAP